MNPANTTIDLNDNNEKIKIDVNITEPKHNEPSNVCSEDNINCQFESLMVTDHSNKINDNQIEFHEQFCSNLYSQPVIEQKSDETIVKAFNIEITNKLIQPLLCFNYEKTNIKNKWFSDELINFYLNLVVNERLNQRLAKKTLTISSQAFLKFKRKSTNDNKPLKYINENIFNYELVIIPICVFDHWSLVAIHTTTKKVRYFDSKTNLPTNTKRKEEVKQFISDLINSETNTKNRVADWIFRAEAKVPHQESNFECGLFTCIFAKCLVTNDEITTEIFKKEHLNSLCMMLVNEIKSCEIVNEVNCTTR